jgi:hypothetical protein
MASGSGSRSHRKGCHDPGRSELPIALEGGADPPGITFASSAVELPFEVKGEEPTSPTRRHQPNQLAALDSPR